MSSEKVYGAELQRMKVRYLQEVQGDPNQLKYDKQRKSWFSEVLGKSFERQNHRPEIPPRLGETELEYLVRQNHQTYAR